MSESETTRDRMEANERERRGGARKPAPARELETIDIPRLTVAPEVKVPNGSTDAAAKNATSRKAAPKPLTCKTLYPRRFHVYPDVAPLKQQDLVILVVDGHGGFHVYPDVAPLKPDPTVLANVGRSEFPRLPRRGPIETRTSGGGGTPCPFVSTSTQTWPH